MKPRCSIMWCPWRAKYSFGIKGYYECWFHGNLDSWYAGLWNTLMNPISFYYNWMKYHVVLGERGIKWKFQIKQW